MGKEENISDYNLLLGLLQVYDLFLNLNQVSNDTILKELQNQEILGEGENRVDIDLESHKQVLRDKGYSEDKILNMSETELRKINTGSKFYVTGKINPVDCIEDINILFNI